MPIYEYRCQQCGTTIETMQRMADAPLKHCDACGADALERLISQTSFVLKGSGWYVTDFRGGNTAAPAKKDGDAAPGKAGEKPAEGAAAPTPAPASKGSDNAAPAPAPAAPAASGPSPAPALSLIHI